MNSFPQREKSTPLHFKYITMYSFSQGEFENFLRHTITVPSDYTVSAAIKNECKVYYIKRSLFDLGRTTLNTPAGNEVPVYDLERTICDMIRSRNKVGTETFLAALKLYAASPKKDLNKLHSYAKKMRVANVLRQYLEVLL